MDQVLSFLEKGTNLTKIKAKKATYTRFFVDKLILLRYESNTKLAKKKMKTGEND